MDNKFKKQLEFYKNKVNLELEKYFELKVLKAARISPFCKDITKSLADYTLRGGKRVRALLFIYGYKAILGKITTEIVNASISMELVQSFLLIHDDIMDQDNLRRGGQTIHKEYSQYYKKKNLHFGENIAIITGDLACTFSYEIINNAIVRLDNKVQALKYYYNFVNMVNYGQSMDVFLENVNKVSEFDVEKIHLYKTAPYTGQLPILTGAVLGGANPKELKMLNSFAIKLGQAFQVQDDLEGTFGKPSETGKPADSDIRKGKKTLLIVKALEKANGVEKKHIIKCSGNGKATAQDIQKLREIIFKTGSFDYSINKAKQLISEAIKIIKPAKIDPEAKDFLINLAKYILVKDKIVIPK